MAVPPYPLSQNGKPGNVPSKTMTNNPYTPTEKAPEIKRFSPTPPFHRLKGDDEKEKSRQNVTQCFQQRAVQYRGRQYHGESFHIRSFLLLQLVRIAECFHQQA